MQDRIQRFNEIGTRIGPSEDVIFTQYPMNPWRLSHPDPDIAEKQHKIVNAFKHTWKDYAQFALGYDEYRPLSQVGKHWSGGDSIGLMVIDSLDTMLLMNLTDEYAVARDWVSTSLEYSVGDVSFFETTIRALGGLLSAYHLSGNDPLYLEKAVDLGDRLMGAFHEGTPIPFRQVTLSTGEGDQGASVIGLAEMGTIQLEFKYLSSLTGNPKYRNAAEGIILHLKKLVDNDRSLHGLFPIMFSSITGEPIVNEIHIGANGDSYYEYLLKQYLQTKKTEPHYKEMYDYAVEGIKHNLIARSYPNNLMYSAELPQGDPTMKRHRMEHLVCFMGASFVLGATEGLPLSQVGKLSAKALEDIEYGKELTRTCFEMYSSTSTGLSGEAARFNWDQDDKKPDMWFDSGDAHNILRPEAVESLFVLWRITGDNIYREWGWMVFEAFERYSKIYEGGYSSVRDVNQVPPPRTDHLETFWLAETLKYLYLLFSPNDVIPLDHYVFNTEAHPFPVI